MTEQKKVEREGTVALPRRLTAARKQEAVLGVLRGEVVELVTRNIDAASARVDGTTRRTV